MESEDVYRWYQSPSGDQQDLQGLTRDRQQFAAKILPGSLRGESLLDVGCAEGVFCAEALLRGATKVVGIDKKERRVSMANQLQTSTGPNADFVFADFEDMTPDHVGEFDYVVCLNVIHHALDPVRFIQKLAMATRKKLILEIAGLDELEAKGALGLWKYFFSLVPRNFQPPVMVHGVNSGFCLSPRAVTQIVQKVPGVKFRSIEIRESYKSYKKTRYLFIASK